MPSATAVPARTTTTSSPARPRYRADIEGLRAIAVLAVLGFHASVPWFGGGFTGVDVFFVISGFLITGLLLDEALTRGSISLREFFARRARRLLPAASLVLVATSVASWALLAPLRRQDVAYDVLTAAISGGNWRFVAEQTDYLAAQRDPSPLLHYWSLGVEEQFYVQWAPVVCLLVLIARRMGRRATVPVAFAVALATGTSFALSLHWTHTSVSLAYMGSPSRAWQFGVGAAIALLVRRIRQPRAWIAVPIGWIGALAVVWSVARFDSSTPYPGTAALVPTFGCAALIFSGTWGVGRAGVGRLLASWPLRAIGRGSYSLYLWHWPMLVLIQARAGLVSWPIKLAIVVASAIPAFLTLRFVERPLRTSPTVVAMPRRGLAVGVTAVLIPLTAGLVVGSAAARLLGSTVPVAASSLPAGAATGPSLLAGSARDPASGEPVPSPAQARRDFPPDGMCEVPPPVTTSPSCLFGAGAGGAVPADRIVLIGDSHAGQWFSPFLAIAARRHWSLEELVKQGCPLPAIEVNSPELGRQYTECDTWRQDVFRRLAAEPKPRLIVVSSLGRYTDDRQALTRAWEQSLRPLTSIGVPVVYVRDTPFPGKDIPVCVSGAMDDWTSCAFSATTGVIDDPVADRIVAGREPGVSLLDLDAVLCPRTSCPAVSQRVLLYRDDSHLTNATAVILTARIERALTDRRLLPKASDG